MGINKRPGPQVVDATAGLGRDAFVLADLGCEVVLLERSAVIYALLEDGLRRAALSDDAWLAGNVARMHLHQAEATQWLAGHTVDVVYLDPMFPQRRKSARVKKEMWVFRALLGHDDDGSTLLQPALDAATYRVVVKRPLRAPPLADKTPGFSISGKAVRFDVYVCE